MSIINTSININTTTEKVWESLMNPENLKHWLTGFVSAEALTGKVGEVGSTSKLIFNERGKEMEVTETVLVSKPNHQYRSKMKSKEFEIENDIRLISFGHYTEMIQTEQFFPKGFFMKLMFPLIKGALKKRMTKELIQFKNFVESTA